MTKHNVIILKRLILKCTTVLYSLESCPLILLLSFVPWAYGIFSAYKRASYLDTTLYWRACVISPYARICVYYAPCKPFRCFFCVCVITRGIPPSFKLNVGLFIT